jgi:thioester reductase-like protein
MIEKYSAGLDRIFPLTRARAGTSGHVVLLTGSTGNLGSQILASLLNDPRVEKVYALNRASSESRSMFVRHQERFEDKALDATLLTSERLVFVEGDTAHLRFGLSEAIYDEVSRCTVLSLCTQHSD